MEKTRARGQLRQALLRVGQSTLDPGQRDALARVLYWRHSELAVGDIGLALGFADGRALAVAVGAVDTGVTCRRCAAPLLATSHSQLAQLQKFATGRPPRYTPRPLCDSCEELRARAEADDEWLPA